MLQNQKESIQYFLKDEVEEGRFRMNLYHRLSVYPIVVPALRERQGDVALLAGYFAEQLRRKLGLQQLVLEPALLEELNRIFFRAVLLSDISE